MVAVGMRLASEHFSNYDSFQTAFDGLNFFHAAHFQTNAGKGCGYFVSTHVEIDIVLEPLITDIHLYF